VVYDRFRDVASPHLYSELDTVYIVGLQRRFVGHISDVLCTFLCDTVYPYSKVIVFLGNGYRVNGLVCGPYFSLWSFLRFCIHA